MLRVIILTTVHSRHDSRVFYREAPSIGAMDGVDLQVVVADGLGTETRQEFRLIDLGVSRAGRLGRFTATSLRAWRYVRSVRPDVLHVHDPELLPLAAFWGRQGNLAIYDAHENLVSDIHDKHWIPAPLRSLVAKLVDLVEKTAVKRMSAVIAATPTIAERFPNARTVLVQNYPSLELFRLIDSKTVEPSRALYLGSITRLRGIPQLVEAMESVTPSDSRLTLAGPITEEDLEFELAASTGWNRTDYLGILESGELQRAFHGAAVGVCTLLPARNFLDSKPTKVFEYMAAGLPVVISDFPVWRDMLEPIGCAIFVDPNQPSEIAEAISSLLMDERRSKEMGERGRAAIQETLNWGAEERKLTELYASFR